MVKTFFLLLKVTIRVYSSLQAKKVHDQMYGEEKCHCKHRELEIVLHVFIGRFHRGVVPPPIWLMDCPILCYIRQKHSEAVPRNIVVVNLADSELPQRKVALGKKDNFLNFVSMIQNRHDASVSMFFNRSD